MSKLIYFGHKIFRSKNFEKEKFAKNKAESKILKNERERKFRGN